MCMSSREGRCESPRRSEGLERSGADCRARRERGAYVIDDCLTVNENGGQGRCGWSPLTRRPSRNQLGSSVAGYLDTQTEPFPDQLGAFGAAGAAHGPHTNFTSFYMGSPARLGGKPKPSLEPQIVVFPGQRMSSGGAVHGPHINLISSYMGSPARLGRPPKFKRLRRAEAPPLIIVYSEDPRYTR